jgi:hypothetical protein
MIRIKEQLFTSSTYSLKRSFKALKGTITEYFGLEIFTPECLSRIKRILNFLTGFLIKTERIVSLRECFYDAINKINIEYGPFIRRPRFFKELLTTVS